MDNIKEQVVKQRRYFNEGQTKNLDFRLEQLKILRQAIINSEKQILDALRKDLNKSPFEAYATEIGIVLDEIAYVIKHLPRWTKRKCVKTSIAQFLSAGYIYPEPYGVVLIISPWNYPFQLAMAPLIGAIAAGNCAIIKPSEFSVHTSSVINKLIRENFSKAYISVVVGGQETSKALLEEKFDYIFFTGSVQVGKVVMAAASKHLTPVTLELGGKSPCIVDETANISLAAKRIVWGKFLNAGQTCVAPDYILVHNTVKDELVAKMKKYITKFYGVDPSRSPKYPKIINQRHFKRLIGLLKDGRIVFGGQCRPETQQISPTIIDQVTWDNDIMKEEIFGPLLPILTFDQLSEVVATVNKRPKPLALYYFSKDKMRQKNIIKDISFGGGCINDTIVHLATPYMPFGGVGESGMGSYHGKGSFDTFSHQKSVLKKSNLLDIPLRYPPFKDSLELLKKIM